MRRRYHSRLPEIDWPYLLAPTLAARPDRRVPSTGMGPARHHRVSNGRSNVMERIYAELRRNADERPDHAALVDASHVITYRELWPALQLAAATMRGQRVTHHLVRNDWPPLWRVPHRSAHRARRHRLERCGRRRAGRPRLHAVAAVHPARQHRRRLCAAL